VSKGIFLAALLAAFTTTTGWAGAQTQKAIRYEGPATIQLSFTVLGQVAGAELFSNPAVSREMSGIEKFFDTSKLEALKAEATPGG
jgi:hypothetical protein